MLLPLYIKVPLKADSHSLGSVYTAAIMRRSYED